MLIILAAVNGPLNPMVRWELEAQVRKVVLSPCQREAPVEAFSSSPCPNPSSPLNHGRGPLPEQGRQTRSQLFRPTVMKEENQHHRVCILKNVLQMMKHSEETG